MIIDMQITPGFILGLVAFIIVVGMLIIGLLILWIWSIIHCLASKRPVGQKILWIIAILLLNFIGSIFYLLFKDRGGNTMAKNTKNTKKSEFKGKRLYRSNERVLGGVCAGIAEYFTIDPTIVRLVWVILTIMSFGAGILAYIIAWIIVPEKK